jgi:hypothetical protein
VVEHSARGNASGLGGAIGASEDEGRATESAELGLQASVLVGQPLDPFLLPLELLALTGPTLPGLRELLLELAKPPTGNGDKVVFLWGETERKGLGEDGFHASERGNFPAKYSSVEGKGAMDQPVPVGIPDLEPLRQTASGT